MVIHPKKFVLLSCLVFTLASEGFGAVGQSVTIPLGGTYTRSVSGDLTGHAKNDVVLLSDNQWILLWSPTIYHASLIGPSTANDVAVLKNGVSPTQDSLLVCNNMTHGIEQWGFNQETNLPFPMSTLGDGLWQGVRRIQIADLDGDGFEDIIGLRSLSDGDVVILYGDGAGFPLSGQELVQIPENAYDLEPILWTPAPAGAPVEKQLALRTTAGIRIVDRSGALVDLAGTDDADAARFAVGDEQGTVQTLATVCAAVAGGAKSINNMRNPNWDVPLFLGNLNLAGVAVGDLDDDGYGDLVISHKQNHELLVFWNQRVHGAQHNAYSFSNFSSIDPLPNVPVDPFDPVEEAPENDATPLITDIDGDGDMDTIFPVQRNNALFVDRNDDIDDRTLAPKVDSGTFEPIADTDSIHLTLVLGLPELSYDQNDFVEMTVWVQDNPLAPTQATGLARMTVSTASPSFTFPIDEIPYGSEKVIHTVFRIVQVDGSGNEVIGPATNWAFTRNAANLAVLADKYELHGDWISIFPAGGSLPFPITPGGWDGDLGCVPCFGGWPDPPPTLP